MKLLKTIQLSDLPESERQIYRFRRAARAIVFDSDNKIALLHNAKHNYHKLPGGGVEAGEDVMAALKRECLEEIGCAVEVLGEIGSIVEYRDEYKLRQESYCYLARLRGDKCRSNFTRDEEADGFSSLWLPLPEAIRLIENERPNDYSGKYIVQRDLAFLREFEKIKIS